MAETRKHILLAFTAIALLAGCDDAGDKQSTNFKDWLPVKREMSLSSPLMGFPPNAVRETQAGNYLAGQFAQYRQDWKMASLYLDKAIKRDPGNIELQQRAMVLAVQAGEFSRATMLARKVLETDPKHVLALLFLSVDEFSRQEYSAAEDTLEKMPKNGITDFIRPILIAWANAPKKTIDEDELITGGPLHAYHALLISDYIGKVENPEKFIVQVLAGGTADAHTMEMMGDIFARQGHKDLAEKIYEALLERSGDISTLTTRYENIDKKREDFSLVQTSRIQTPAQGAAEAFFNMAHILTNDQSFESALVFGRLSQFLEPANDNLKILMARLMLRGEHTDDAVAFFETVSPDSPEYLASQRSIAELLEEQKKTTEAIAFLEKSYTKNKDINALIQIGDIYRRAEKYPESIQAYDRAMATLGGKASSDYWHLLYARGMSHERNGNLPKAEADLEAAMEFRPDHPYLLNYLGYSWADQGKHLDKALMLIEKAVELKPDDGYIVDSLGWVYYKEGRYEEAVAELEKAVELVPYDPTINDHLGDAYWQVGRKNEARFQWQRALNHADNNVDKNVIELKVSEGIKIEKPAVVEAKSTSGDDTSTVIRQ